MIRAALLLALLAAPATAAERPVFVASFDRLRVEGPFRVTVAAGRSASARISGDPDLLDRVEVRLDGTTLVVRASIERWQEQPRAQGTAPVVVTLATPTLSSAIVIGGGELAVTGARAARLDLSVTGSGSIALTGANAEQANATVIGSGRIALAGRAAKARLLVNGAGKIDAVALDASELVVRVDGPGETLGRARYTATVTNVGLGHVAIAGTPRCIVRSDAGGPVQCGAAGAAR